MYKNKSYIINKEKANEVLLWVISRLKNNRVDFHKLFKILYFAEQKHLVKYGKPIIGDVFIAMKNGPVPSEIYHFLKSLRQNSVHNSFIVSDWHYVESKEQPDLDEISESEIRCLEESVLENQDMSFSNLSNKSHKSAWENANEEDNEMSFLEIAKEGGANAEMLKYIALNIENQQFAF